MLASLQNQLALSPSALVLCISVVLFASIVRGFAGFGLSALIMAGLVLLMPPVSLIPLCVLLELVAGFMMARGGFAKANKKISWGLAIFSTMGVPIGLMATINISTQLSSTVALLLILALAALQLSNRSPAFLGTTAGLVLAGLTAGIANGLASVGGMVVALFVLAQRAAPAQMRASVVLYLLLTTFTSFVSLSLTGLMDALAFKRALFLAPLVVIGVIVGGLLFKPAFEHWYKRFCLCLLIGLAMFGLGRLVLGF